MTAEELFTYLSPHVAPAMEAGWKRRDLCVLSTRVVIEVAKYFGIQAEPVACKVVAYNAAFAGHLRINFADVADRNKPSTWGDGSWSVGIGMGAKPRVGHWDGHLIAVADGFFGDFAIQQAERLEHDIITGPAVVGPYFGGDEWRAAHITGCVIDYKRTNDERWRTSPDWTDESRRRRIVGQLIRIVRTTASFAQEMEST